MAQGQHDQRSTTAVNKPDRNVTSCVQHGLQGCKSVPPPPNTLMQSAFAVLYQQAASLTWQVAMTRSASRPLPGPTTSSSSRWSEVRVPVLSKQHTSTCRPGLQKGGRQST